MTSPRPFQPPPYPYDRLKGMKADAEALVGGVVDCSIGTPYDAPPATVLRAMSVSGTERGYPPSAGIPALRRAASDWLQRRFDVAVDPNAIAACVGTKEFVASAPHFLRLRDPSKDTVLYPAISYPSYAMGATLAGCRAVPVPPLTEDGAGLDLSRVNPEDASRALMVWSNSPSNPTGGLGDLAAEAEWGRKRGIPIFSDECYCEFTWSGPPQTILSSGLDGVVAVHSLSKRSNLAGVRAGFYAGQPDLVAFLRDVRQHAGLMVPGPVQSAAAVALADDEHVEVQRRRYHERLTYMADLLTSLGLPTKTPEGGFYLWVRVPDTWEDAWAIATAFARYGGLLVSPGDLYGPKGAGYLRIALVQPMVRLRLVAERLQGTDWSKPA